MLSIEEKQLPILYTFRRCPYAIRARLAIQLSGIKVILREVRLQDKPRQLLLASIKGTVPVLVLDDGKVLDESMDIMHWSLNLAGLQQWSKSLSKPDASDLLQENDGSFKENLDKYKYADRFPEKTPLQYRQQAENFIARLELLLADSKFLLGSELSAIDLAIFPFVRQFSAVDKNWFENSKYVRLYHWLTRQMDSELFKRVMVKYPPWKASDKLTVFPESS